MNSATALTLNMQLPNYATVAYAVQGDSRTRQIIASLVDGSTPWTPPAGALPIVRYVKPDGTVGFYDTLEGGGAAVTTTGNVATITLAQQMLAVPGDVIVQLNYYTSAGEKITTFNFRLLVQAEAVTDMDITSNDYFNVLTQAIAQGAAVAQQLTFPVPIANGGTGSGAAAGARVNLGLNGQLTYVGQIPPGQSVSFSVRNSTNHIFFISGISATCRRALIVSVSGTGEVYFSDTYTGTSSDFNVSTGANSLIISNSAASTAHVEALTFTSSATVPTTGG